MHADPPDQLRGNLEAAAYGSHLPLLRTGPEIHPTR